MENVTENKVEQACDEAVCKPVENPSTVSTPIVTRSQKDVKIYRKLTTARAKLQLVEMKKSGHNKFANFDYFELGDFLPHINRIFDEVGLCGIFTFGTTDATLTIVDCDSPEDVIVFYSPVPALELKGANAMQSMGGAQTYIRRYLWMMALEIVEHDEFDAVIGKDEKPARAKKITTAKLAEVYEIAKSAGISKAQVIETAKKSYQIDDITKMSETQWENLKARLETAATNAKA